MKVACILVGLVTLLTVLFWSWIERVSDREWASSRGRLEELREQARARLPRRQALRGKLLPGNAWVDYKAALEEARKLPFRRQHLQIFVFRGEDVGPEEAARMVEAGSLALEHLRLGARRETALMVPVLSPPPPVVCAELDDDYLLLEYLAISKARLLCRQTRAIEGGELLLDFCQFMLDLWKCDSSGARWRAASGLWLPLEELQQVLRSPDLSPADFLSLQNQLEILDAAFPPFLQFHLLEVIELGDAMLAGEKEFGLFIKGKEVPRVWRFGFSRRLVKTAAFRTLCESSKEALPWETKPYAIACRGYEAIHSGYGSSNNPIVPHLDLDGLTTDRLERERLAYIRLLRIVAHFKATGEVMRLEDPLGDVFPHQIADGRLKVSSRGLPWCSSEYAYHWFEVHLGSKTEQQRLEIESAP